jgi:hypothetical protein
MAGRFTVVSNREQLFPTIRVRAKRLNPALRAGIRAWRNIIRQEFASEGYFLLTGGFRAWPKTKPFGRREAPAKTLQRTGALLRAYMGTGSGALENIGDRFARFGVDGNVIPYGAIHRRGAVVPVTEPMRRTLSGVFDVHLRSTTSALRIPARPHAVASREVREILGELFAGYLADGTLKEAT